MAWVALIGQPALEMQCRLQKKYQVHFQANHDYKAGQFIIYNDSLKYAKQSFVSNHIYNANDWQQYEKNNYAKFNVAQTWIEYINRLVTGLLGFIIIAHIVWSFRLFWKTKQSVCLVELIVAVINRL